MTTESTVSGSNRGDLDTFYDRELLPLIDGDPNQLSSLLHFDPCWTRRRGGVWRATSAEGNPWGVKADASRIVYQPGKLGPYIHGLGPGGTWLELVSPKPW